MDARKKELLGAIIKEYVGTAEPVGSKLLAGKYFDVSSATIRNHMAELEKEGFIGQPHTSAGRIPTEKGFRFFVESIAQDKRLSPMQKLGLEEVARAQGDTQAGIKQLAKKLSEFSKGAVIVAFGTNDAYYTGISNLFSQPEFCQYDMVRNISAVIDHLDEAIRSICESMDDTLAIFIGEQNPFGSDCSSVLGSYEAADSSGIIGLLGPMRMDYETNYALLRHSQKIISDMYG